MLEYVFGVIFIVFFVLFCYGFSFWLNEIGLIESKILFKGMVVKVMEMLIFNNFFLLVLIIVFYGMGYIVWMMWVFMVEVMMV